MKRRMEIVRDAAGLPAPHADRRWVPLSTMAEYEGVDRSTVYRRMLAGEYPADGVRRRGRDAQYLPAACFGIGARAQGVAS